METHKKDSDEVSEKTDWGFVFMLLKNRGFTHDEILKLSYPQFNAYMNNINNALTYDIVIPYLGSGQEDVDSEEADEPKKNTIQKNKEKPKVNKSKIKRTSEEITSKEELISVIAMMNSEFKS